MKSGRIPALIIVFALLFQMFGAAAFAQTSRTALITRVSGDVTVTKGGGFQPIPAYTDMPLSEGDTITTGEDGSVTVTIADPESERTIGANSEVTISELKEDIDGKKSGFKVWIGSMWNKVQSLAAGDEDKVDTPTATLGVRGTRYLVITNPDGTLSVVVASGLVEAIANGGKQVKTPSGGNVPGSKSPVLLAPTQQLDLNPSMPPSSLANGVSIVNVTSIVRQVNPQIIRAIILDAPSIVQENNTLLDELRDSLQNGNMPVVRRGDSTSDLTITNLDDLNRVTDNLNGLVSNVATGALTLGKIDPSDLRKLIDEANGQITNPNAKIDMHTKPIDPTAGGDPAAAAKKKQEQDRIYQLLQQQQQDHQNQLNELTRQLGILLQQAQNRQKQQDEQNKKNLEELNNLAESQYTSGLTDEQKKQYEDRKNELNPNHPPAVNNSGSGSSPTPPLPAATPKVNVSYEQTPDYRLSVTASVYDMPNVYGVELHFVNENERHPSVDWSPLSYDNEKPITGMGVTDNVYQIQDHTCSVTCSVYSTETVYSVPFDRLTQPVSFDSAGETLVTIPFFAGYSAEMRVLEQYHVKLTMVKFFDKDGNLIAYVDDSGNPVNFIFGRREFDVEI